MFDFAEWCHAKGFADIHEDGTVTWSEAIKPPTSGKTHHLMARPTGNPSDEVAGVAFRVTKAELAAADTYEVSAYKRIAVRLRSGLEAFVYVGA